MCNSSLDGDTITIQNGERPSELAEHIPALIQLMQHSTHYANQHTCCAWSCVDANAKQKRFLGAMLHLEVTHFIEQVESRVCHFSRVTISVTVWKSADQHVSITNRLHLINGSNFVEEFVNGSISNWTYVWVKSPCGPGKTRDALCCA